MAQLLISISEIPGLSSGARRALVGLISFRNQTTGQCNPGILKLCERVQAPERSVYKWLAELRTKGIVSIQKQHYGGVCWYEFPTLSPLFAKPAKSGRFKPAVLGRSILPNPAEYYPIKPIEAEPIAAASSEVDGCRARETMPAAAAPKAPETPTQKPPARATDDTGFRQVREALNGLARMIGFFVPDDDLVWRVIDAANGASGQEITDALVGLYKQGALRNMRSWGYIPLKITDLARRAATA